MPSLKKHILHIAAPVAALLVVAGCSTPPPAPEPKPEPTPIKRPSYVGDSVVSHRVIFEFDKAFLSDDAMAIIAYHADYLADHPDTKAVIQGNASSPGSHTYNYELGLERAQAVAQALINLGADKSQLHVTSTGKQSHTETNAQAVIIAY